MKTTEVFIGEVRNVIIDWIAETDADILEGIYNENFDEPIRFDKKANLFVMSEQEAKRVGVI